MVNGYAPVVFRDYIQEVFWPLFPLDFGELNPGQGAVLKKLKVDMITFHDNALVYTEKISPFPPRLALRRLMASPWLSLVEQDQDIFLFKFNSRSPDASPYQGNSPSPSLITSPVAAVFYANNEPQKTGKPLMDPMASGYYLLMDEGHLSQGRLVPRPGAKGNVAQADPGRNQPGYLVLGSKRFLPSGKYKAMFRIKAGPAGPEQEVGRVELLDDRLKVIGQRTIRGRDAVPNRAWVDIPLEFELPQATAISYRVFFSGEAPLAFNLMAIGFSDQPAIPRTFEAEDLLRQTGSVVKDPLASRKEAVLGQAGYHPPVYLSYGPYQTLEPGLYQADFFLRLKERPKDPGQAEGVLLEVATDMGKRTLNSRKVGVAELAADGYRAIRLEFKVPFRCELEYRVKFLDKADLLIDRIDVGSLENR
jgi:hypothetical protein